jgi:hypothetical protein
MQNSRKKFQTDRFISGCRIDLEQRGIAGQVNTAGLKN